MKRKIICVCLAISTIATMVGCGKNSNKLSYENSEKQIIENTTEVGDETKTVNKTVNVSKMEFSEKQKTEATFVKSTMSFAKPCKVIDELYDNSDYIVEGEVIETFFTVLYGNPYTVINLKINKNLKGSTNENDEITVLLFGGYMTVEQLIEKVGDEKFKDLDEEERKNTLIEQKATDLEYPEVGDRYVLFLMDSNLVTNAFDPVNDYECIFELTGAEYKRSFPSDEKTTQYSIQKVIKNNVSLNINDLQNYCMSK